MDPQFSLVCILSSVDQAHFDIYFHEEAVSKGKRPDLAKIGHVRPLKHNNIPV